MSTATQMHGAIGGTDAAAGGLARIFSKISMVFEAMAQAREAAHAYETLERLSDQRLAARGLKREDIARHVFCEYLEG